MANVFTELFATGPAGADLTTTNTSFANTGTPAGTSSRTFDGTQHAVGTFSGRIVTGATVDSLYLTTPTFTLVDTMYARFYLRLDALPAAVTSLAQLNVTASTREQLRVNADGTIAVRNPATVRGTTPATAPLVAGQWTRVEWDVTAATQTVRLFHGGNKNGTTPDAVLTGAAAGSGAFSDFRVGLMTATAGVAWNVDAVVLDSTTSPGPGGTTPPPAGGFVGGRRYQLIGGVWQ